MASFTDWLQRLFGRKPRSVTRSAPTPTFAVTPYSGVSLGINLHTLAPDDVRHLTTLGMRKVRIPGILQEWEGNPHFRAGMEDAASRAADNGISLLWYLHNVVDGDPRPVDSLWRDPRGPGSGQWVERMSRFAEWVAVLPATDSIQLWNEVNGYRQQPFGLSEGYSPRRIGEQYAGVLALHAERIRAVSPTVKIVATAFATVPGWQDALRAVAEHAPLRVDAYAMNIYGPWESGARANVLEARRIVGSRGPLWVTEFGNDQQNRETFNPGRHLLSWQSFIEGNERERLVERSYGYCLPTDPRPEYCQHGLFEVDGTPRRAYEWLASRSTVGVA